MSMKTKKKIHPNSLKNLKSWKPGQSGNLKGRPKRDEVRREILKQLRVLPKDLIRVIRWNVLQHSIEQTLRDLKKMEAMRNKN